MAEGDVFDQGNTRHAAAPSIAHLAGQVASLLAVGARGDAVSLDPKSLGAAAIGGYLQQAFAQPLRAALDSASDARSLRDLLILLIEQVAALQADNLVLKSYLLDGALKNRVWDIRYQDPLMALRDIVRQDGRDELLDEDVDLTLQLGPKVLGSGWHVVESQGNGAYWRWMGPETKASLVLPAYGPGDYRMTLRFRTLDARVTGMPRISVNYAAAERTEIKALADWEFEATFQATLPRSAATNFLIVEFEVDGVLSPADIDPNSVDRRPLGIGLGAIGIRKLRVPLGSDGAPAGAAGAAGR